jgi:hypothetical protein
MNKIKERIEDLIWDIRYSISKMSRPFRILSIGIKNIIAYSKVIYNDRDFDDFYLFILLKFKIDRMIEHCSKYSYMERKDSDIIRMKRASNLLGAIVDTKYEDEFFNYLDQNRNIDYSKYVEDNKLRAKRLGISAKEYTMEHWVIISNDKMKQCRRLAFETISNHSQNWWF